MIGPGHGYSSSPSGLTALLSHEVGHALGPNPSGIPNAGETAGQFATRMRDESLRDEGRAAMSNIRAAQEVRQNCPSQGPVPIGGEPPGGNWEQTMNNAGSPQAAEQAIGQQFGNLQPSNAVQNGFPPGTDYNTYYYGSWYQYGVNTLGLVP
jgi:hypothetical protein